MARGRGDNWSLDGVAATPLRCLWGDRSEAGTTFRIGRGELWWNAPPERMSGEIDPIRTGVKFTSAK